MMTLEPRIVRQYLSRRDAIRRSPQRVRFAREHHRSKADSIAAQLLSQPVPALWRRREMSAVRNKRAYFGDHTLAQDGVSRHKADYHCVWVFAEQPEEPAHEPLLHRFGLTLHSTAQARAGVAVAAARIGVHRC